MIKNIVIIFLFATSTSFSQYFKTYDWDKTPDLHTLSEADMKQSSVGILKKIIVEYKPSVFGNNIKLFETTHTITKVNDDKGISRHNTVYIPMYNVKDVMDIKARTISKDGKITELNKDNIKEVKNVEEYGDFKIFAIEGVEKNAEIEILYTVEKEYDMQGSESIQSDYLIKNAEFMFVYGELNGKIKVYRTEQTFGESYADGRYAKVLKLENIPAMIEEEYATTNANKIEVVYQCFAKDQNITQEMFWNNVVNNVGSKMFPEKYSDIVKNDISTLLKGQNNLNRYQIINLIDDFIKTNYSVVQNNNPELSDIDYILKNRVASDYGILQTYTQYLTALEIEYEIVITANRFTHKFDPDFFNPNALREFLIFIPDEAKYIAPDRIEYRFGEAPFNILGNYGLYITNTLEYYFSKIVQNEPLYSRVIRTTDISFDDDLERVTLDQRQKYTGHWSVTNRAVLNFSGEQDIKEFEDYLTSSGIEDKVVESFETINPELLQMEYNKPFITKSVIVSESLLEEAGDSYLFQIGKVIGTQSELYQETERVNPIEMTYPNQYDYTITVNIPDGYNVEGLESLKINEAYQDVNNVKTAKFESDYVLEGNTLTITIQEFYKTHEFDLHKYEEFRAVINAASDFNKAVILLSETE
ncbi:MAG: hypothetical protein HKO92_11210 [Flavobacteriaceae bacterium]|nr:hypothetical protein [Flavobacteriaceae bacterium]